MKVLQINSVCGYGSTGRIATDLYKVLVDQGHECIIAYGRGTAPEGFKTIKIGSKIDNYTHVAKTRLFDKHGFGSVKATKDFIEKVKEYDPDIIHLHNIHGYYINIEILFNYLKEANKPVVWTLHDCWAFTGHCAYFDYIKCDKWKTGCFQCPEKKSYPSSLIFDFSKNSYLMKKKIFTDINNLTIVTPSKWLANMVEQSYLKVYPVIAINNGIDLDTFKPTKNNFREKYRLNNKFTILGVANVWDRRKGLKYFLELYDKLSDSEVIVLVGLSEKQLKEIPEGIIGISRTNNVEELVDIYSSADVFVNPTLEDNFPTTNLESLACGTPVITFDTGGSPESINERTGRVVEKGNIEQLVDKIHELESIKLKDSTNILTHRAKQMYNKHDRYEEYLNLYKYQLEK